MLPFVQLTNGPDYKTGWVHSDLCALLDAFVDGVEQGLRPRLMIWMPPRHGKSQIVSRAFPAFLLGRHPEWEIINATYGMDLAADMGRTVRATLNDPLYHDLFPELTISADSNAQDRVDTFRMAAAGGSGARQVLGRGGYKAVGVGTALTGRGAHVLIIDDPVKDREHADSEREQMNTWNWYSSTARTRLAPGGGIVLLQTRWADADLSGKLLEQAKGNPKADQWCVFNFPAIATKDEFGEDGVMRRRKGDALHPQRFPLAELEQIRASLAPRDWSALYQQNPSPDDGTYFRREWFRTWGPS